MSRRIRLLQAALAFGMLTLFSLADGFAVSPSNWSYLDLEGNRHSFAAAQTACDNITDGGTIGNDVEGCANPSFQAPMIVNLTSPSGGSGTIEYLWMTTNTDPAGAQPVSWTIIPGSTTPEYTPPPVTQTTYYMRCSRRSECTEYSGESNFVVVEIDCCDNATDGGTIEGDQTACGVPFDPGLIRNTAGATGGSNGMRYTWYSSTSTNVYVPGSPEWVVASSATTPYLDPAAVSEVTYFVRVANREFCSEPGAWSNVVTINAFPVPSLKADTTHVTCFGNADGSANITIIDATSPFTYQWLDNGSTDLNRSGMAAGDYQFEIIDGNGCATIETVTINEPTEINVSITAQFDNCNFVDADLEAIISGGTTPYQSVTWNTGDLGEMLLDQPRGTYDVTVVDANGCSVTASIDVNPAQTMVATETVTQPVCYGANGSIEIALSGGTAPFTYNWSPNVSRGASAFNLGGGTYTVTITDANGCQDNISATLVQGDPIIVALDADEITCNGAANAEIRNQTSGGLAPYTFAWSNGETSSNLTNVGAGTYEVTVTDANNCTTVQSITVTEPVELTANIDVVQPVCGNDGQLDAVVNGGTSPYRYVWSNGATSPSLSNLADGTYDVQVTDANGCIANATATVVSSNLLQASIASTDPICYQSNGTIDVTLTGGTAPFTYVWTPTVSISGSATNLAGGAYTVNVTDANGCTATVSTTLDDTPAINIVLDGDDVSCNGAANAEIRNTTTGGLAPYVYAWSNGASTPNLTNVGPGFYEVTVTDANGCTEVQTITLAEPNALTATIDVVQPVCGEDGGELTANITGGTPPYDFNWGPVGQANVQTLTNQPDGNYELNVTDAGGCVFQATTTIVDVPEMQLTTSSTNASCPGEMDGTATVSVTGGEPPYALTWDDGANQTDYVATNLAGGTYTITITDNRGCVRSQGVFVGNLSTGPIIESDVDELDCFGGSDANIRLTVTGGVAPYTFMWNDGASSPNRSNLSAGTYEVTVTDNAGCEATSSFEFTEPVEMECTARPITNFQTYFNVSRFGATDGAAVVDVVGGVAPYTYRWDNGDRISLANNLPGGNISVTVEDANGCTCTHDTTMVEPSMISDFIWVDADGDGIQDATEEGLEGVSITLTGSDFMGMPVNFNETSAADGSYRFDQLPMGNYFLILQLPQSQDYLNSPLNQGGDPSLDSDMDPVTGTISRMVTAHGVGDTNTDAGFIPRESVIVISDRAWYDENHDGIQNPFETSIQGVTLRLIRSTDGFLVNSTVTDEEGNYFFNNVAPGTYYVEADESTSSTASDFIFTDALQGTDENVDSDIDPVTKRSADIVVTSSSPDIDNIDIGLHENCGEVDTPGVIAGNESVCNGEIPAPITSVSTPTGAAEYQWIRSNTTVYRGSNDPNWTAINGARGVTYQPSSLVETVHYIRLAKVDGCNDFTGASNVITKTVNPLPQAEIISATSSVTGLIPFCRSHTLEVAADNTVPATHEWYFGEDATPRTATGPVISGISFSDVATRTIYLSIESANGCIGRDSLQVSTLNCFGPGVIGTTSGRSQAGTNTVNWDAISLYEGSYFDIERKLEQGDYEVITSVRAQGLGEWFTYSYEDKFAPTGEAIYRVVHRAPTTEDARSAEVLLAVEQASLMTKIYPNPVNDLLTVELATAEIGDVQYEIINSYGKVVLSGIYQAGRHELNTSNLPTGTYYLRAIAQDGTSEVRALVKH